MLFINITCGIGIISVASPMAQESVGMTEMEAATMVGLMGLFNGLGRFFWASMSDLIGRPWTYSTFFVLQIAAFLLLGQTTKVILFQGLIFLILSCYGGGFATVPAYLGDLFGTKMLSTIHGYILTAWAAAGLAGPSIFSYFNEATKDYTFTLYVFSGFFVLALIVSVMMQGHIRKLRAGLG